MKLAVQLTGRQCQRLYLTDNSCKYSLETVRLSSVKPSSAVVGVQKMVKELPVEVVEVIYGIETLTLTSEALQ